MVREVRRGASRRAVAKKFGVSKSQVDRWVRRADGMRLDRVDWSDQLSGQRTPHNKSAAATEEIILTVRKKLKETSALGEFGAEAIHRELMRQGQTAIPTVRTINNILQRHGQFDGKRRV
jgi:transposase